MAISPERFMEREILESKLSQGTKDELKKKSEEISFQWAEKKQAGLPPILEMSPDQIAEYNAIDARAAQLARRIYFSLCARRVKTANLDLERFARGMEKQESEKVQAFEDKMRRTNWGYSNAATGYGYKRRLTRSQP